MKCQLDDNCKNYKHPICKLNNENVSIGLKCGQFKCRRIKIDIDNTLDVIKSLKELCQCGISIPHRVFDSQKGI